MMPQRGIRNVAVRLTPRCLCCECLLLRAAEQTVAAYDEQRVIESRKPGKNDAAAQTSM
jgi:hypothetical protein